MKKPPKISEYYINKKIVDLQRTAQQMQNIEERLKRQRCHEMAEQIANEVYDSVYYMMMGEP